MTNRELSANAAAVRAAAGTRYYGQMYFALATLAYADESRKKISNVTVNLEKAVAELPSPPVPSGDKAWGTWSVDWGPALFGVDENLMYVASFRETGQTDPVITVLAIRGTDTEAGLFDVLAQVFEDTRDWLHVSWSRASGNGDLRCLPDLDPFDRSEPKIAAGTCEGLQRLRGLSIAPTAGGAAASAEKYLQSLLARDPALPIVVTGHSLGACQTTVMAMYLAHALPAGTRILPNPYAPPTAGNEAFATLYDQQFAEGNFWWNTIDLVPNAFAEGSSGTPGNLMFAEGLWQDHGGAGNTVFADVMKTLAGTLPQYVQPTTNNVALPGQAASTEFLDAWLESLPNPPTKPPNPWEAQLMWQHLTPNYYLLLRNVPDVAEYPFPGPLPPQ